MKHLIIALLATAAILAVASARADTRVSIGVNVGIPTYRSAPPAVVYAPPPPAVVVAPARGYWKDVTVRTWVPERWVASRDRWGRPIRYCEPGYYALRTDRVWVETPDRGHVTRGYAFGYDARHDHREGWKR